MRRTRISIVVGKMVGSSIDNDEDDVASISKKFQDKGLTFLSHCGNRKDVPNSGGSINGREKKGFRFRSSVCNCAARVE